MGLLSMRIFFFCESYLLLVLVTLRVPPFSGKFALRSIHYRRCPTCYHSPSKEQEILEETRQMLRHAEEKFPFRINCLQRSIVLQYLLRRRQIATQLQI